jgi:hypothetical protein
LDRFDDIFKQVRATSKARFSDETTVPFPKVSDSDVFRYLSTRGMALVSGAEQAIAIDRSRGPQAALRRKTIPSFRAGGHVSRSRAALICGHYAAMEQMLGDALMHRHAGYTMDINRGGESY